MVDFLDTELEPSKAPPGDRLPSQSASGGYPGSRVRLTFHTGILRLRRGSADSFPSPHHRGTSELGIVTRWR